MARLGATSGRPRWGGSTTPIPPWLPVLGLLAIGVWGIRELGQHAEERGVGIVDTSRFKLHERGAYSSRAWRDRVARVLVRTGGALEADDRGAIRAFCDELAGLSFVAEVGRPEVVWPDGLTIPLRYREPVACVRVGHQFLPVDGAGRVLLGKSVTPHEAFGAWLPVTATSGAASFEGAMEFVRPGDMITDPAQLAGFAVAASMWEHLESEDVLALGRILIDASSEYAPDGLPGGVVIDLEDRRRILFGRPPVREDDRGREDDRSTGRMTGRAGELPLQAKWANIRAAARALNEGREWVLFDARWDAPEVIWRGSDLDLTLASHAGGG